MLLSNIERTEIESKSQLGYDTIKQVEGCYQIQKELKLKANHNALTCLIVESKVVIKYRKN